MRFRVAFERPEPFGSPSVIARIFIESDVICVVTAIGCKDSLISKTLVCTMGEGSRGWRWVAAVSSIDEGALVGELV